MLRVLAIQLPLEEGLRGICRNLLRPRLHARGNQDPAVHAATAVPVERCVLAVVRAVHKTHTAAENQIAVRVDAVAARGHVELSARDMNPNLRIRLLLLGLGLRLVVVLPRIHAVIVRADVKATAAHLYGLPLYALARVGKDIGTARKGHRAVRADTLALLAARARPNHAALQIDALLAAENIVLGLDIIGALRDQKLLLRNDALIRRRDDRAAAAGEI